MQSACAILSSAVCLAIPYFFHNYFINGTIFGGGELLTIKCVLIFSTNSVRNISHFKKNSARYYHKYTQIFALNARYSCQKLNLNFLNSFSKNTRIPNFIQIRPVRVELYYAEKGREKLGAGADLSKLKVAFRNFANAPREE